ncbi:MAG: TfuA-like protein [Candidatus Nanopelagicales bacterium]
MIGPDIVFLGPSLSHAEAQQLLPDAIILPPAAMGDVLAASLKYRPHAIGLIDGTFLSTMSVFHKELLFAMEQGSWLLGASSMGALRAAECAAYGMIGVGQIYEDLASGLLEDDDEVALTHADAEANFRSLSDAMVAIRATLAAARSAGLLTDDETTVLIQQQKDRWFPDRRLSGVLADAADAGLTVDRITALREFVRTRAIDPKRQDAIALLERMRSLPPGHMPQAERPETYISGVFAATLARDVAVSTNTGTAVTLDRLRRYAALHDPNFTADMSAARRTMVLSEISRWLGGPPTDVERSAARVLIAGKLGIKESDIHDWATSVDLRDSDLSQLIGIAALTHRVETSWLGRSRLGEITTPYLNHLRLEGRYSEIKEATALQYTAAQGVTFTPAPSVQQLIGSMVATSSWQLPSDIQQYIEATELGSVAELLAAIEVSIKAHQGLYGVGLVDTGNDIKILEDGDAFMSRGN